MKRVQYIVLGAALLAAGCTGFTDTESVTFRVDKHQIFADGHDAVTFIVEVAGTNVSDDAVVRNADTGEVLEGNVFTTETPGTYNFTATYSGADVETPVVVTAKEAALALSVYYRAEGENKIFTFEALFGTRDVSLDEGLAIVDDEAETALERTTGDYYRVTTVGSEEKRFHGEWNGNVSAAVKVGGESIKFYKRVGIMEFTGTWCTWCPVLAGYIKDLETGYPDRHVMMAVHYNDNLAISYAVDLAGKFNASALPAAVLDFGDLVTNMNTSTSDLENRVRTIVEENPAPCGLAVATSVVGGKVEVTVKLSSAEAMQYGLAVALVENGVTGYPQTMPPTSAISLEVNYIHDHTLRELYANNIEGVSLGNVAAGAQAEREFSFDLKNYNPDNCHIVVYATSGTGAGLKLMNAVECGVGESVDFKVESAI